jgi:hypothetical protein
VREDRRGKLKPEKLKAETGRPGLRTEENEGNQAQIGRVCSPPAFMFFVAFCETDWKPGPLLPLFPPVESFGCGCGISRVWKHLDESCMVQRSSRAGKCRQGHVRLCQKSVMAFLTSGVSWSPEWLGASTRSAVPSHSPGALARVSGSPASPAFDGPCRSHS